MGEGFGVDPPMLARTAQGIRGVVDTLGEVGHGYLAGSGRGLELLALGGEESGHPVVAEAVDGFVARWSWGIRTLVQDGQAVAQALDAAGIEYDGVHLDVLTTSNVGTDSVALEFRTHPDDPEPIVLVEQFGDFGSNDVRIRTFADVELPLLRAVIAFAKHEHGVAVS